MRFCQSPPRLENSALDSDLQIFEFESSYLLLLFFFKSKWFIGGLVSTTCIISLSPVSVPVPNIEVACQSLKPYFYRAEKNERACDNGHSLILVRLYPVVDPPCLQDTSSFQKYSNRVGKLRLNIKEIHVTPVFSAPGKCFCPWLCTFPGSTAPTCWEPPMVESQLSVFSLAHEEKTYFKANTA